MVTACVWEHNGDLARWELLSPRLRIVMAFVTDEFIEKTANLPLAAAHLRERLGSVPPPMAGRQT